MNFPYEKPHCPSVPLQQYFLTTQIPGQHFICNHSNWYLQPTFYPMPTTECYFPLLFHDVGMSNTTSPMFSPLQTKGSEQNMPFFKTSNFEQPCSNNLNHKKNGEIIHSVVPGPGEATVLPMLGSETQSSYASQFGAASSSSASFPRVLGAGVKSSFTPHGEGNVKSLECRTSSMEALKVTFANDLPNNELALMSEAKVSHKPTKYPGSVRPLSGSSDEQKRVDDITERLSQRLHLEGPEPSTSSLQLPLEVIASSSLKFRSKRGKSHHKAKFESSQSLSHDKQADSPFLTAESHVSLCQFSQENPEHCPFLHLKAPAYFGRTGTLTSWAAVAAEAPNFRKSELRVLKRTEPLPPAAAPTPSTALPSRIKRRALRTQRDPRRGGHLTDFMKERMLLRYRSLLAQSTEPRRRGKERLTPKKKPHSHLKAGILRDRLVRSMLRQLTHSCEEHSTPAEATRNVVKIVLPVIPDLEAPIEEMVKKLAEFHDRAYKQRAGAPAKRKNARRIVCGFHEVVKGLKLNKLKFLIIANDLEKGAYEIEEESANQSEEAANLPKKSNALAKTLKQAVDMARERGCPVMLAFKRRYLQRLCHKGAAVSCVGVINVAGAEDMAKAIIEKYREAVDASGQQHLTVP
ncbi:unnamed protein product [Hydatigera taeniaeformis]|uniref:Ribosomal_L7Ae domain-containing protein n=1 Tax=Hydatigena taeniaeformis TaxID=6205 RepID=A0A0R3WLV3_HYDTA|nr:unnamed protein product [Hydatigera taeniaeformis]